MRNEGEGIWLHTYHHWFFFAFLMFIIADWANANSFMSNLEYSSLIKAEFCEDIYVNGKVYESYSCNDKTLITLEQGLILPLLLIAMGMLIAKNILGESFANKFLPFLDSNES